MEHTFPSPYPARFVQFGKTVVEAYCTCAEPQSKHQDSSTAYGAGAGPRCPKFQHMFFEFSDGSVSPRP